MVRHRSILALICGVFAISLVKGQVIFEPNVQPLYAQSGLSFTMKCKYSNTNQDKLGVEWYHARSKISTDQNQNFDLVSFIQGDEVTSTLTKNLVTSDDGGTYECRPKGGKTGTGFMTSVTVITVEAENDTLKLDHDAVLGCKIVGDIYTKINFKWYRAESPDAELKDGTKYKIDQDNKTLTIKSAVESDAGKYLCKYRMDNGFVVERTVSLNSAPFVKKFESTSKNLVQGDPLTINCEVWSEPEPVISWLKDNEPLDTSDERIELSEYDGLENATLRIDKLNFDDRAEYTCRAENQYGVGNKTVMVRVKDKLAALWPFLGICAEVVILCTIIFIYEKRRAKRMEEEEVAEEAGHLTNSHDHKGKDEIRQRK